jgi:hypothetical protein
MMSGSRKSSDLRRDPRLAVHSAPLDTDLAVGDARISGRAVAATDPALFDAYAEFLGGHAEQAPPEEFDLYTIDVAELMLVTIGDPADHLLIRSWRPGRGESSGSRY